MKDSAKKENQITALPKKLGVVQVLVFLLILVALSPVVVSAQGPAPALAPLIFEKPNSSQFEVIWFHQDFHSRTIGNLTEPNRFFAPYQDNREGIVSSRVALAAPFAVGRVASYLETVDAFPALPGDQHTPLDLQLTVERENLTAHPTDIEFSSPLGSATPGFVTVFPNVSFSQGDSLYVGLQWRAGTPRAPMVGVATSFGGLDGQEYVYLSGGVNQWQPANELGGVEIEVLGWRPDTTFADETPFGSGAESAGIESPPHFVIWYAADSTTSIVDAFASGIVATDTLSWVSALESGGYVSIVAEDSAGLLSDTTRVFVDSLRFKKVTLSSPVILFDWRNPSTLTQNIFVTNESTGPVNLRLRSDDSRVVFSDTTLSIGGGSFKVVTFTMQEPPRGSTPELHSLYIFNDRGWLPLKTDMRAIPDIRTSVHDDIPKPLSFELSEVYPNPNYGFAQLRIVSPQSRMFKVEIYNVLGQLLQSEERQVFGESQIPLVLTPSASQPLAAGVYFVRVSSGEESTMRKMVFVK